MKRWRAPDGWNVSRSVIHNGRSSSVTARSNSASLTGLGGFALLSILIVNPPSLLAQEAPEKERQERPELPPLTATVPPEEALAAIKRRAMKILEARRAARRLKFS